jgi:hypothetical protein
MKSRFDGHLDGILPASDVSQALDAVKERRRILETRGGNYEASGKLWLKEICKLKVFYSLLMSGLNCTKQA